MATAHYTIGCTHPETGRQGSWLFSGADHRVRGTALSPIFASCADLFDWLRANGWTFNTPGCAWNEATKP